METEIKHGTSFGYRKCIKRPEGSCEICRAYNRKYSHEKRLEAKRKLAENPDAFVHGTAYTFKLGCPCPLCKEFGNQKNREYWNNRSNIVIPEDAHGTPRGYTYYKCRCEDCDAAIKIYRVLRKAQTASRKTQGS